MDDLVKPIRSKDAWINKTWRPAMGWTYMATCITDFIVFPVLWAALQAYMHVPKIEPWSPLTLQGAGLYHIAMGAVLGVAAWSRGKEKISRDRLAYDNGEDSYDIEEDIPLPKRNTKKRPVEEESAPI